MQKLFSLVILALIFTLTFCAPSSEKTLSEEEQRIQDSISKVQQRASVDSAKKKNPLLILPPDSDYTGSYVDRYPNGIVKFQGYFRFGKRHGQWMSFYPTGLKWSELHFDKGLRHGPNMTYQADGKLNYSGYYKLDRKDSIWCYYDSVGQIAKKILFKQDQYLKDLPLK